MKRRVPANAPDPAERPLRRDAAENRLRLITAAEQVFAEHGFEAGVEEVARHAGVGMGTLYRRFPSKQALIDELVGGIRRDLLGVARDAMNHPEGTGLELLLFEAGQLQAAQRGCLQRLWNHSDAELDTVEEIRRHIAELLKSAQEHGRIRPEITSTDISMIFWSVAAVIETTTAVAPTAWRRHLGLLIAGLRPPREGAFSSDLTAVPVTLGQARKINSAKRG